MRADLPLPVAVHVVWITKSPRQLPVAPTAPAPAYRSVVSLRINLTMHLDVTLEMSSSLMLAPRTDPVPTLTRNSPSLGGCFLDIRLVNLADMCRSDSF